MKIKRKILLFLALVDDDDIACNEFHELHSQNVISVTDYNLLK